MNGEHTKAAIANRNVEVIDPASGVKRMIYAGSEVPPNLREAYENTTGDVGPGVAEVGANEAEAEQVKKAKAKSASSSAQK